MLRIILPLDGIQYLTCRRPLPWRSQELNDLFLKLDRKRPQRSASMTIERRDGSPSEREAPDDAPEFALS